MKPYPSVPLSNPMKPYPSVPLSNPIAAPTRAYFPCPRCGPSAAHFGPAPARQTWAPGRSSQSCPPPIAGPENSFCCRTGQPISDKMTANTETCKILFAQITFHKRDKTENRCNLGVRCIRTNDSRYHKHSRIRSGRITSQAKTPSNLHIK